MVDGSIRRPSGGQEGERRVLAAPLALVVFLLGWSALAHGFYTHGRISDTARYQSYGVQIREGQMPYRDFGVEYPPAALPMFVVPTFFTHNAGAAEYAKWFARLMAICGLGCLAALLLGRAPRIGLSLYALTPLLLGTLVLDRFDLWPAALTTAALVCFLRGRDRVGWFVLAVAIGAKLFPLVLVPLLAVWTLKRRGRRELRRGLGILSGTLALIFVPFALIAPHGLWESLWGQLSRPIQIESIAGSFLIEFGQPVVEVSHSSFSIAGHSSLGLLTTAVEVVCLVALWVSFARGPGERERLVRHCAASVVAFIAFGKVLSPQYLIWLVPLVALVPGKRGVGATVLLGVAMLDTQFWFVAPRYNAYATGGHDAWLVIGRDVLLVAVLAVLALPGRRPRTSGPVEALEVAR